jgi:hypothetical protein
MRTAVLRIFQPNIQLTLNPTLDLKSFNLSHTGLNDCFMVIPDSKIQMCMLVGRNPMTNIGVGWAGLGGVGGSQGN